MTRIYSFFLMILFFSACNQEKKNVGIEPFETFERKFHTDSVFQISRIIFPIPNKGGLITGPYPTKDSMWTKETWVILGDWRTSEKDTSFFRNLKKENNLIIEEIGYRYTDIFAICKYKLYKKKWYLIYFAPSFAKP